MDDLLVKLLFLLSNFMHVSWFDCPTNDLLFCSLVCVVERYVGDRYRVGLTNLGWHIARVCHSLACYIVIVINIMVIW